MAGLSEYRYQIESTGMLFVASQRNGGVWRYSQREYRHNVSHLNVVDNFLSGLSVCKALEPSLANLFLGTQLKKKSAPHN